MQHEQGTSLFAHQTLPVGQKYMHDSDVELYGFDLDF